MFIVMFVLLPNSLDTLCSDSNISGDNLKGQCHEMVVEIRPWSGRFGLN
jgi:hypothetical protein